MNILLVNPSQVAVYVKMRPPIQMPMGLAYIAAVLEGDDDIDIVDMDAEGLKRADFVKIIRRKHYDIAGITSTTPTLFSAIELAEDLKRHSPETTIVFGGIHPTVKPYETINFDCVDIVVKGEGEITFKEIVEALKGDRDLSSVKGLIYKRAGAIEETPPRSRIEDLDGLPFPARHLFKFKKYTYPDALYKNTAPMITSRGCPGRCSYCNVHNFGRAFKSRSARNVVDEIEYLVRRMDTKEIHIWDDNFTTIKKRVFQIRDEISRRGLKVKFAFPNGIRADFLDGEIMEALKDMGTYSIAIGVESGSQKILNRAHKGISLEKIEEVFMLAKKMKFETWAFFIIGLLEEDFETVRRTIDFAKKIDPDIAKFHILKPYPGTDIYEYMQSKGYILTEDYNQFGIHTPPIHRLEKLTPSDMLRLQKMAYTSFYLRPIKILKQILRIRSLNRFILNLKAGTGLVKMYLDHLEN